MRTILIPTDFSDNARNACLYALSLFNPEEDNFILLNAFGMSASTSGKMINIDKKLQADSINDLKIEEKKLSEGFGSKEINLECLSELGRLTDVVRYLVKNRSVDYIVMGTQGASGLEEVLIGSNTFDVIREVRCPVIAVPEFAKFEGIRKIVFAADYKRIDNNVVLTPALDLAKEFDASIQIINVRSEEPDDETKKEQEQLHSYFSEVNHNFNVAVTENISEGIETFVYNASGDLLVMLARKNGFFDSLFQTSATRKLTLHSKVPVLALHDQ